MVAGVTSPSGSPLRLTDIASQAQVREATVSRVLNGKAGVAAG
ncbi:LacI family DNA-binding transcriptional regulator, partial [Streptomyces sp. NPDC059233]